MKWLKLFEDYNRVTLQQLIDSAKKGGYIYTDTVKGYPEHDADTPIKIINVDNDGLTTVDIGGNEYEVEMKNIRRLQ